MVSSAIIRNIALTSSQTLNTTTPTTITDGTNSFSIAAVSGDIVILEGVLYLGTNSLSHDMVAKVTAPTGSTGKFGAISSEQQSSTSNDVNSTSSILSLAGQSNDVIEINGRIVVGDTAGNIEVQVAGNSGTDDLVINQDSYLEYRIWGPSAEDPTDEELQTEINNLRTLINAGAQTVTIDGQTTTFDLAAARRRLRELREQLAREQGTTKRRPIFNQIKLS